MQRLVSIDIIRGYCIVSMVTAHVASGSMLAKLTHPFPEFDGASGFILLAGLVLGMVRQRHIAKGGLAATQKKTLRRIGIIYAAQFSLVVLGILTSLVALREHSNTTPLDLFSIEETVFHALSLTLAPPSGSVLRLYVVLMLFATVAFWLLRANRWKTVAAGSAALYAVGGVFPAYTSFVAFDAQTAGANWATWQVLFISALLIGWYWQRLGIGEWLVRHSPKVAAVSAAILASAYIFGDRLPWFFDKVMLGFGRIGVAYAVVSLLFVLVTAVIRFRVIAKVLYPVQMVGKKSLDSYIIQAAVVVSVPSFFSYSRSGVVAMALAIATLLFSWAWAEFRIRRKNSRVARREASAAVAEQSAATL